MTAREPARRGALRILSLSVSIAVAGAALAAGEGGAGEDPVPAPAPSRARSPQTIRVGPLPVVTFLDPDFDLDAVASSGLAVRFETSGDCAVRGRSVHAVSAGKCTITVSQPGDERWLPAPDVVLRLSIGKAEQKLRLREPRGVRYLDPELEMEATSSSGLPVVLVASGDCEIDGERGTSVRLLGAGRCAVQASQPGDSNFTAAQIAEVGFEIARADQSIVFRLPSPLVRGTEVQLAATASSGLPVRFEASGSCWVVGTVLHATTEGSCTVNAYQPGDRNYNAAPTAALTVWVVPLLQ